MPVVLTISRSAFAQTKSSAASTASSTPR
jgi:hypothetical protein